MMAMVTDQNEILGLVDAQTAFLAIDTLSMASDKIAGNYHNAVCCLERCPS